MTDENEVFNEVRDAAEIGPHHYPTTAERQLNLARYAMHKVRLTVYNAALRSGQISEAEAKRHYEEAMRNFDGILNDEAEKPNEGRYKAALAEMERGFYVIKS